MDKKLERLKSVYRLYDSFMNSRRDFACQPGCHTCCTGDLTVTTAEGWYLREYCRQKGRRDLVARLCADRRPGLRPTLTINGFAAACLKGQPVDEEDPGHQLHPCPLLEDGRCAVYPARPLGCRAMVSTTRCALAGQAQMPDFVLTVSTVFHQVVEQLDLPGYFGNLVDVVKLLEDPEDGPAYFQGRRCGGKLALLANEPARALMVPPEHRLKVKPLLEKLQTILAGPAEKPGSVSG